MLWQSTTRLPSLTHTHTHTHTHTSSQEHYRIDPESLLGVNPGALEEEEDPVANHTVSSSVV